MTSPPPTGASGLSQGRLRWVRRLQTRKGRLSAGAFLAEGPQAVREALQTPAHVEVVFASGDAPVVDELVDQARDAGVEWHRVAPEVLGSLCDTVTPQGVLAVCRTPQRRLDDVPVAARLVVVCAQLRDPGNAGTVIRCADAFGADAVVFTAGSVEAFSPKTVRASVGSIFHVPVIEHVGLSETLALLRKRHLQVFGADGAASRMLDAFTPRELARPTAWVLGNEAWGLAGDDAALVDERIAVPLYGRAESLNVSTAAAVLLYASASAQRAAR